MFNIIFWDFDGVIMSSNKIRDLGFEKVLQSYPGNEVNALLDFHRKNGGLSRYVKFRYFFEQIRKEEAEEEKIQELAKNFSIIMRELLTNPGLLINDSLIYIRSNYEDKKMHIVSGSDQEELQHLCKQLNISHYFKSIHGSPAPKNELVGQIIKENNYNKKECILIGDSINDYEAAEENNIDFYGYNNNGLRKVSKKYINSFSYF